MAAQPTYTGWERPCSRTGFVQTNDEHDPSYCAAAVAAALAEVRQAQRALQDAELILLSLHPAGGDVVGQADARATGLPVRRVAGSLGLGLTFEEDQAASLAENPWRRSPPLGSEDSPSSILSRCPTFGCDPSPPSGRDLKPRGMAKASLRDLLHSAEDDVLTSSPSARTSTASSNSSSSDSVISFSLPHSPVRATRGSYLEQIVEEEVAELPAEGEGANDQGAVADDDHVDMRRDSSDCRSSSISSDRSSMAHLEARRRLDIPSLSSRRFSGEIRETLLPQTPLQKQFDATLIDVSDAVTPDSTLALSEMIGLQLARDISNSRKTEPPRSRLARAQIRSDPDGSVDSWPSHEEPLYSASSDSEELQLQADALGPEKGDDTTRSNRPLECEGDAARTEQETAVCRNDGRSLNLLEAFRQRSQTCSTAEEETKISGERHGRNSAGTVSDLKLAEDGNSSAETLNDTASIATPTFVPAQTPAEDAPLPRWSERKEETDPATLRPFEDPGHSRSSLNPNDEGLTDPGSVADDPERSEPRKDDVEQSSSPHVSGSSNHSGTSNDWHDWSTDSKMFLHPRRAPDPPDPSQIDQNNASATAASAVASGIVVGPRALPKSHLRTASDLGMGSRRGGLQVVPSRAGSAANDQMKLLQVMGVKLRFGRHHCATNAGVAPAHRRSKTLDGPVHTISQTSPPIGSCELGPTHRQVGSVRMHSATPPPSDDFRPPQSRLPHSRNGSFDSRVGKNLNLSGRLFAWKAKGKNRDQTDQDGSWDAASAERASTVSSKSASGTTSEAKAIHSPKPAISKPTAADSTLFGTVPRPTGSRIPRSHKIKPKPAHGQRGNSASLRSGSPLHDAHLHRGRASSVKGKDGAQTGQAIGHRSASPLDESHVTIPIFTGQLHRHGSVRLPPRTHVEGGARSTARNGSPQAKGDSLSMLKPSERAEKSVAALVNELTSSVSGSDGSPDVPRSASSQTSVLSFGIGHPYRGAARRTA